MLNSNLEEDGAAPLDPRRIELVPVKIITVAKDRRELHEATVNELMESIKAVGLLAPLVVAKKEAGFALIAGQHRLAACARLGFKVVPCNVLSNCDALHACLAEVDENLIRHQPGPSEHALLTGRRAELLREIAAAEALSHGATPSRQAQRAAGLSTGPDTASIRDQAARTGQSKDKVARSHKRSKILGAVLRMTRNTSLDSGRELDALVELPAETVRDLAERAAAGEIVSAQAVRSQSVSTQPSNAAQDAHRDLKKWRARYGAIQAVVDNSASLNAIEAALLATSAQAGGR